MFSINKPSLMTWGQTRTFDPRHPMDSAMPSLLLIRHTTVCDSYRGICYGQSDVPLHETWQDDFFQVTQNISSQKRFDGLYSSPLSRCAKLAHTLAAEMGQAVQIDHRLMERNFGTWELQQWSAIYEATGAAMDGLVDQPETFAPPGGETTRSFADRVWDWCQSVPAHGDYLAVTHGGCIAAIRGLLLGREVRAWLELIPKPGELVEVKW